MRKCVTVLLRWRERPIMQRVTFWNATPVHESRRIPSDLENCQDPVRRVGTWISSPNRASGITTPGRFHSKATWPSELKRSERAAIPTTSALPGVCIVPTSGLHYVEGSQTIRDTSRPLGFFWNRSTVILLAMTTTTSSHVYLLDFVGQPHFPFQNTVVPSVACLLSSTGGETPPSTGMYIPIVMGSYPVSQPSLRGDSKRFT